jgi:hypothetical protein
MYNAGEAACIAATRRAAHRQGTCAIGEAPAGVDLRRVAEIRHAVSRDHLAPAVIDLAAFAEIRCVASGDHRVPMDGGSACDLRAAAITGRLRRGSSQAFAPPPTGPTPARRPPS